MNPERKGEAGVSLIEALIAAGLMLIVAVGVLPLFTRAIIDNAAGNEYTQVSNHGKSRAEEFFQLPFNGTVLTVASGSTETAIEEYWAQQEEAWKAGAIPDPLPTGEQALWTRDTVVRQYGIGSIDDDPTTVDLLKGSALDGGTSPDFVHLKEVQVTVETTRVGGPLGSGKRVLLRTFRAM